MEVNNIKASSTLLLMLKESEHDQPS